ncbi:non-ribosomal peptide synthetase [Thiomonas sp.]|uniref:non-ribosomal peptide synthetase n=1 Tax=Thiomonas sp. TaxID=2047785 RepID=UPI00262DE62E|nr:non-ribosomal peptide synthetase [Thiomonas sp.]
MNTQSLTAATAVDYDPFADAAPVAHVAPTTEAQREIWLACQLGLDATLAYNESVTLHLRGAVDLQALTAAVQALPGRHDALRATLSADGQQLLIAESLALDVAVDDLRALPPGQADDALRRAATQAVATPFDLQQGPLLRARLLWLADDHVAVLLSVHHIVCDGWSFGVLLTDLATLYAANRGEAAPPAPAVSFAAFAQALAARQDTAAHHADETYWLQRYASVPAALDLPCDHPRPAHRRFASRRIDHVLPPDVVAAVRQLASKSSASLFSTLLCAFGILLQRICGQDEVVVGVPAAGQTLPGYASVVGHGVNLLPLRLTADTAAPLAQSLATVQSDVLDAFEHQHYTFGTLLQKLLIERDPSRVPLAAVMFNLDQAIDLHRFAPLRAEVVSNPRCAENFELFVNASPQADGSLQLQCQYAAALFDDATVQRWLASYETLLVNLCAAPDAALGAIDIVTAADRQQLQRLNATAMPLPPGLLLHQLLHAQAVRTPDACAQLCGGSTMSYAQLWAQAHRIAHALRARGVRRGARVGLCLPRDADMLPALLGVLVAGAGYVPLDPSFPAARLTDMAADADLALLIAKSTSADALPWPRAQSLWLDADAAEIAAQPGTAPAADAERDATPESLAYMIYTSGSTGKPKGVMLPHRAVVNFLLAVAQRPGLQAGDMLLAVTTLSFDIAVLELLLPLAVGGSVLLASREQAADGFALRDLLATQPVTAMQATPSTWRLLLSAGWGGNPQLKALVGGEPLPADLAAQLLRHCGQVWNLYGPTETTVWSSCWPVQNDAAIAIGTPLANTQIWVLDPRGKLCPIGVPGEIHIGGAGVALGYWQRETLTAERFVADVFSDQPGARLYRTGDRGRWRNDGQLEHLGRLDFQVKLRGFRIELGDVESHLTRHPAVAQAVALVREDTAGDARLVAYVVPPGGHATPTAAELRAHLAASLPGYMVPQHIIALTALPLLPNGKIDRKRLPSPLAASAPATVERRQPHTATQRLVADVMQQVLHLPGLALDDDFFALGGHSLLAAQLAARLRQQTGLDVQMRTVFDTPTIEGLSRWIDAHAQDQACRAADIAHRPDQSAAAASLQQGRIWFLEQLDPGLPTYNTPSAHRLRGPLDVAALERAINAMVARQASLRTVIVEQDGVPVQRVAAELTVRLGDIEDLSALPASTREAELMARLQARSAEVFDLGTLPLFKLGLYRLAADDHVLFFMPHHIIWDGWSFDLVYEEMAALYSAYAAGRAPQLPPLTVTYGDYAAWQRQWLQTPDLQRQLRYWRDQLTPLPAPLNLPADRPRPLRMTGRGQTHWFDMPADWFTRLHQFAQHNEATPYMVLLAAFAALLWRQSGQTDLVIGTPVRGRPSVELEQVMGFFVNALPLRIRPDPAQSFAALVRQVRSVVLNAFAAPDAPLEQMLQFSSVQRDDSRNPIYQAFFSYQDVRQRNTHWGAVEQENLKVYQPAAAEDVRLWFLNTPRGVTGGLTYNTDVFDAPRVAGWVAQYDRLLAEAMADPAAALHDLPALHGDVQAAAPASAAASAPPAAALRAPAAAATSADAAPTETERQLAALWSELLAVPGIQPDDNFFDLGGHSLLVMQALSRMEKLTGKRLGPRHYVFDSLRQIAREYDRLPQAAPSGRKSLLRRLFGKEAEGAPPSTPPSVP